MCLQGRKFRTLSFVFEKKIKKKNWKKIKCRLCIKIFRWIFFSEKIFSTLIFLCLKLPALSCMDQFAHGDHEILILDFQKSRPAAGEIFKFTWVFDIYIFMWFVCRSWEDISVKSSQAVLTPISCKKLIYFLNFKKSKKKNQWVSSNIREEQGGSSTEINFYF